MVFCVKILEKGSHLVTTIADADFAAILRRAWKMRRGISDLNFYYINKLLQWIVSIEQINYD